MKKIALALILVATNCFSQWKKAEANNIKSDIIIYYDVIYENELTLEQKNLPEYKREFTVALNKDFLIERKFGNKITPTYNYTLLNYETSRMYRCSVSDSYKAAIAYSFDNPQVRVTPILDSVQKTIFGYPCERGIVNINNNPREVLYTKKIGLRYCKEFNIDGFLLEFPGFTGNLGYYTVKVKKITYNNNLPKSFFSLDGFTVQTKEEISKYSKEREAERKEELSHFIGTKAPNVKDTSIKKKVIDSKKMVDNVIVYNFWFTTCAPCKAEIPKLNQLKEKYKDKNIHFVAIALDPEYKIDEFTKKTPLNYDILYEGSFFAEKFGITAYPSNIVVDGKGIIQFYEVGYKSDILERISYAIDKCLVQ